MAASAPYANQIDMQGAPFVDNTRCDYVIYGQVSALIANYFHLHSFKQVFCTPEAKSTATNSCAPVVFMSIPMRWRKAKSSSFSKNDLLKKAEKFAT
jgi:hypothetical protein